MPPPPCYFPTPYPDELLYSVFARWVDHLHLEPTSTRRILFGPGSKAARDYQHLCWSLNSKGIYGKVADLYHVSLREVVERFTTTPFYRAFHKPSNYERSIRDFEDGPSHSGLTIAPPDFDPSPGLTPSPLLWHCPECWKEEQQNGEPYWHRSHQLPTIAVCPKHGAFLEHHDTFHEWVSLRRMPVSTTARYPKNPIAHCLLKAAAEDASWLLHNGQLYCSGQYGARLQGLFSNEIMTAHAMKFIRNATYSVFNIHLQSISPDQRPHRVLLAPFGTGQTLRQLCGNNFSPWLQKQNSRFRDIYLFNLLYCRYLGVVNTCATSHMQTVMEWLIRFDPCKNRPALRMGQIVKDFHWLDSYTVKRIAHLIHRLLRDEGIKNPFMGRSLRDPSRLQLSRDREHYLEPHPGTPEWKTTFDAWVEFAPPDWRYRGDLPSHAFPSSWKRPV